MRLEPVTLPMLPSDQIDWLKLVCAEYAQKPQGGRSGVAHPSLCQRRLAQKSATALTSG